MNDRLVFKQIYQLARPYLNTRYNDVHTEMSMQLAYRLLRAEGGQEDAVIPAIILHDVGWQKVPAALHLTHRPTPHRVGAQNLEPPRLRAA